MPTAAPRKRKKKTDPSLPVKFSVPLPGAVHRALAIASIDTGVSQSTLIRTLIEQRFAAGQLEGPNVVRLLAPPSWRRADLTANGWRLVSVFLPPELRDRATAEVRRQFQATANGDARWNSGSLAAAAAALTAEKYMPELQF